MTHLQPQPTTSPGEELLAKYGDDVRHIAWHSVEAVLRVSDLFRAYAKRYKCDARLDDDGDPAVYVYIATSRTTDYNIQYNLTRAIHEHLDARGVGINASIPFYAVVWYVSEKAIPNDPE